MFKPKFIIEFSNMILLSKITANIAKLYSNTTTTIITTEIAMIAITNQVFFSTLVYHHK